MNCDQVKELLNAFLDDELDETTRELVAQHLQSCPACAVEHVALKETAFLCQGLDEVDVPDGLARAVQERLKVAGHRKLHLELVRRLRGWQMTPRRMLGVAAVALVVCFTAGVLWNFAGWGMMAGSDAVTEEMVEQGQVRSFGLSDQAGVAPMAEFQSEEDGESPARRLAPLQQLALEQARKVIKNANLTLQVVDVQSAYDKAVMSVEGSGGYVQDATFWDDNDKSGASLVVRVPERSFPDLLADLRELGEIKKERLYSQDVSMEYYDIQARLRNLQTQEERLLIILGKAEQVSDILMVEKELERVRGEVESLQGRIQYFDHIVAMATVAVNLEEPGRGTGGGVIDLWDRIGAAFWETVREMGELAVRALVFAGRMVPWLILAGIAWWAVRYWQRRQGA